jgi:hypothetical protein
MRASLTRNEVRQAVRSGLDAGHIPGNAPTQTVS